ncbi:MAG: imidazole glycerol phosphate synthase subunit HisF [Polyangiaceae bacterium]
MLNARLIPRLDIKGPNLVKGIHLEGLRVLGKPERFARHYYEHGADELLFVDAVASLYGRNSLVDIIRRTASEVFIPLTVAGGIRTLDDIRTVLRAGADKVALNTAAVTRPELVSEAARRFGSSTIVVSIEAIKRGSVWEVYTDNGRERTGLDALQWAQRASQLGAGELLVTSVDREGTGTGYDLDLTRIIADSVPIPVIACGGAGNATHLVEAFRDGRAQAVAAASIFHYHLVRSAPSEDGIAEEINTAHLREGVGFGRIADETLPNIRAVLRDAGISCLHRAEQEGAA